MRFFIVIFCALLISACSIEKMAEKILPDDIQQKSQSVVTAVFDEDINHFIPLKNEDMSFEDFETQLLKVLGHRSAGDLVSRHIVNAKVNTNMSTGVGRTKTIEIAHEVETTAGFTVISTRFMQRPGDESCCALTFLNVQSFDESPAYKRLLLIEKISKITAIIIPLGLILIFALALRSRRKKRQSA